MSASRNKASLAPIIVALVLLASISLLGFIVALWPGEPAAAALPTHGELAPLDRCPFERGSLAPPPGERPRPKWM